jgi:hypothetical protein
LIHNRPTLGNETKAILHKTKLGTLIHSCHAIRVEQLKCRYFFVEQLIKCAGSCYRASWQQFVYLMTAQFIACCQDIVSSGHLIAKEVDVVGDKGSGDTTIVDVQT